MRKSGFSENRGYFVNSLRETTESKHAPAGPLVLVADDHEDMRLLFRTVLEARGYSVIEAADGEEIVRTAESARPDLILMDGSLPRLSGVDATRRIRRSAHIGHVPIVFISGHAGLSSLALAREAGCDEYLVKPFDLVQLENVLEKYCGNRCLKPGPFSFTRSMTPLLFPQDLLGLFELDGAGKVLYYRMDSGDTSPELTGHNFYDDVASFDNVDEFRQCVTNFTRGAKAADSFDFDCHYEGSDHPVRVLLARISEHVNRNDTKSVLVHIRRAINNSLRPRNTEVNTNERDVDQ